MRAETPLSGSPNVQATGEHPERLLKGEPTKGPDDTREVTVASVCDARKPAPNPR